MRALLLFVSGILLTGNNSFAQEQESSSFLQVYLDCNRPDCDEDHIRTEITWVDYVRDRQLADVHIFITTSNTVLSGEQYEFSFIGRREYEDMEFALRRVVEASATNDDQREIVNAAISIGLGPFVSQVNPDAVTISYDSSTERATGETLTRDPWKHWIFTLYGGDFELERESNRTIIDSRWGFFADHRSELWKIRIRPYFNYDLFRVMREGRETIRSSISRHGLDTYLIRSLGPHWSAAIFGDYITRNDQNWRHRGWFAGGVQYSLLPYSEATRREITFTYLFGITYSEYFEVTIFDKTKEWLPRHQTEFSMTFRRPWGTLNGEIELDQYLHDLDVFRAEFGGFLSVRLFEGFNLQAGVSYDMIRDQLSLPKGDATLSEILLQQRELATDYSFSGSIAFTYTFGSKFANVVNTRF